MPDIIREVKELFELYQTSHFDYEEDRLILDIHSLNFNSHLTSVALATFRQKYLTLRRIGRPHAVDRGAGDPLVDRTGRRTRGAQQVSALRGKLVADARRK